LEPQGLLAGVVHVLVWAHRMWGLCRGRLLAVPGAKAGKAGGAAAGRLDSLARPILAPRPSFRGPTHGWPTPPALFSGSPGQVFPPKQIKKDPAESQKQAKKKKRGKGCCQNRAGNFRQRITINYDYVLLIRKSVTTILYPDWFILVQYRTLRSYNNELL